MKKLIAISVVLALLTSTVAFAETRIGASIETRWRILGGATDDAGNPGVGSAGGNGTALTGPAGVHASMVQFSASNDDNNYGAIFKFEFTPGLNPFNRAIVWWEPIEQLRIFLGQDGDGMFNTANLSRWGHHQMDRGISRESWEAGNYLLGNWDSFGFAAIVKNLPVDGLSINLAMNLPSSPTAVGFSNDGESKYGKEGLRAFQVQAAYNSPVGTFYLTYQNADMAAADGRIGLTFFDGSMIPDTQFEIGGSYELADGAVHPLKIGFGLHYTGSGFGVKTRGMFDIRDKTDTTDAGVAFRFDVMPWIMVADTNQILLNIRLVMPAPTAAGTGDIGWHINPYLRKRMGAGHDFRIGLMLEDENGDGEISWRLATSFVFVF